MSEVSNRRSVPLWHFTCEHGFAGLRQLGVLRPNRHPLAPGLEPLIWLTDDPDPERDAVGLTSSHLTCDRLTYRYRALSASRCVPWSAVRHRVDKAVLADLESFGQPETWWISSEPLRAILDDDRERVAA
jgi:hypothetical protein